MSQFCEKCNKEMKDTEFYTYRDGRKTEMCKKCLTMHVDNFDKSTFLWLLEKMDVPYIESEWNILRDRAYAKNPNLTGMSVFGKYISKMKLNQFKTYRWADTERLAVIEEEKKKAHNINMAHLLEEREAQKKLVQEQYENGEISEAQYKTLISTVDLEEERQLAPPTQMKDQMELYNEAAYIDESEIDIGNDLTQDDKIFLAMKWGRLYKPAEWVELEKQYNDMMSSFQIEDADSINTLILYCKTNLKANQAIDCGDIEGYQKLSKVSEGLRKSAKWMAVQNKEEKAGTFDAIGSIVLWCEKEGGFIPRHKVTVPIDIADKDIADMKKYNQQLIEQDPTVFKQVEAFIKKREILAEHEADVAAAADNDGIVELTAEDFSEYRNSMLNQLSNQDEERNDVD